MTMSNRERPRSLNARLCAAILVTFIASCGAKQKSTYAPVHEIESISNDDIKWDGNRRGLVVRIHGNTAEVSKDLKRSNENVARLLTALDSEIKWVAAHVLLVQITNDPGPEGPSEWHGLRVILVKSDKGPVRYPEDAQQTIKQYWLERLMKK